MNMFLIKRFFNICITLSISFFLTGIPSFATERVFFYHNDATGTPLAMTDESGGVVWEADYMPFGEEHSLSETVNNKHRFIGKEKDEETDLYYFGARYLDSRIGRFIKPDPVGITESDLINPQRFNRYTYSLNNPYRYYDLDGNTVWDIVDIGFFAHSLFRFASDPSWANAGDLGLDTLGLLPLVPSIGSIKVVGKGLSKLDEVVDVRRGIDSSKTEIIERAMSKAELEATQKTGLLRAGRTKGEHYVTDHANRDALRARQRLALGSTPEVRVQLEVPAGLFPSPTKVGPLNKMPGGGMERSIPGHIKVPVKVKKVRKY